MAHLVSVCALTAEAQAALQVHQGESLVLKRVPYEVGGRPACRLEVGRDSFLSVESYSGFLTVTWSTALPIAEVLSLLAPRELLPASDILVYDRPSKSHKVLRVPTALDSLLSGQRDSPFVRWDAAGMTFVWHVANYPRHIDEGITPGRFGVIMRNPDWGSLSSLVSLTGTAGLGANAAEVIEHAAREVQ